MRSEGNLRGEAFHERLRARRGELENALLARLLVVSEPNETLDPEYAEGLRAAVCAAVEYGFAAIELGEEHSPSPPVALLSQARLAVRTGIGLSAVLRRYFVGHSLFVDFLVEEAEHEDLLSGPQLQRLLRTQAVVFDRLLTAVSEEHARESERRLHSTDERHIDRIERLLAGELVDTTQLAYDLEAHHLGLIVQGEGAPQALAELASALDRRLLAVPRQESMVWAWLGGRRPLDPGDVRNALHPTWLKGLVLSSGEPAEGLSGWQLTHRQALAAMPIALHDSEPMTRYADIALLTLALQDDLLASSLRQLYLEPLQAEHDRGEVALETLRAYLAAERNVSSAAAALKVSRQGLAKRLRAIEDRLERPLQGSESTIGVVLRLLDLQMPVPGFTQPVTSSHS